MILDKRDIIGGFLFLDGQVILFLLRFIFGKAIASIGIVSLSIIDNTPQGLRRCNSRIPCLVSEIRDHSGEQVEQLLGMGFLDVS